jgi:hypothetical protein
MSELQRKLTEDVFYPPHDPRKASPEYEKTHHTLVVEMDEPCWICGVKNSDVQKITDHATKRKWQIETHHSELEWAAEKAFETDPAMLAKLTADLNGQHPQEYLATVVSDLHERVHGTDPAALREFLDGEGNMLILCATHHRGSLTGIHSVTYPAWKLQRWQVEGGWQFIKQPA